MFKRRPRLATFSYVGSYRYFLTFCTADRHRAFTKAAPVELVRSQILRAAADQSFEIPAYCFMPDHLHLLVQGTSDGCDLKRFVHAAQQLSGGVYQRYANRRLWRPRYFEHVLRDEDDTWGVAAYIVANPVRAGLAVRADEYPFVGSSMVSLTDLLHFVQLAPRWKDVP